MPDRFIPTGVGNTISVKLGGNVEAVHPHGCGEHRSGLRSGLDGGGSSPRVWGTPETPLCRTGCFRFIPTGVGNTAINMSIAASVPVHPHGCGEHPPLNRPVSVKLGSSPRVWGTQNQKKSATGLCRFIPTGVGNTKHSLSARFGVPVHPHGCGEHYWLRHTGTVANGSSPRVWGTPALTVACARSTRFIPTGVGNTDMEAVCDKIAAVHPHGCGEHRTALSISATFRGSSPRVWGTPLIQTRRGFERRFIPTGVGNTHTPARRCRLPTVHPHGCGEHTPRLDKSAAARGSSPRVWGTPRLAD